MSELDLAFLSNVEPLALVACAFYLRRLAHAADTLIRSIGALGAAVSRMESQGAGPPLRMPRASTAPVTRSDPP